MNKQVINLARIQPKYLNIEIRSNTSLSEPHIISSKMEMVLNNRGRKYKQNMIKEHEYFFELAKKLESLKYKKRNIFNRDELVKKIKIKGIAKEDTISQLKLLLKGKKANIDKESLEYNSLSLDCEKVQCGNEEVLARVTLVNYIGDVVLDTFVSTNNKVTNYRYSITGITENDLVNAPNFNQVRDWVQTKIKGRLLVGHWLEGDLKALNLKHDEQLKCDTVVEPSILKLNNDQRVSLRQLIYSFYNIRIQNGFHCSIEDAMASMVVYRRLQHLKTPLLNSLVGNILKIDI